MVVYGQRKCFIMVRFIFISGIHRFILYWLLSPTGDPHQFEQKFNYRRPMYSILKYMWNTESYRESIKVRDSTLVSIGRDCPYQILTELMH